MRPLVLRNGLVLALALALALATRAAADMLQEARDLRQRMQYEAARTRLEMVLPDLEGDARAEALLLHATLVTEPRDARRDLAEAAKVATTPATRRAAVLEQAKLDYARGSYRTAQSRLEADAADPEVGKWLGLCAAGLGESTGLGEVSPPRDAVTTPVPPASPQFTIQLGAFTERSNALRFRATVPRDLQPVKLLETVDERTTLYRVVTGAFDSREAALAWANANLQTRDMAWSIVSTAGNRAP